MVNAVIDIFIFGVILFMFVFVCKQFYELRKSESSHEKFKNVVEISNIIKDASKAYLFSQFKVLFIFEVIIFGIFYYFIDKCVAISFLIGALFSWFSGFFCMYFSVINNKRVVMAASADSSGYDSAFSVSFGVGKMVAVLVNLIALISCYGIYYFSRIYASEKLTDMLISLSFGASLISVFARIGGGIFTKAADMGADLVGKIENNLSEDDPRNSAVIADNVGDNVGDALGMSADLFESFVVITSSVIAIINSLFINGSNNIDLLFVILFSGAIAGIISLTIGWNFNESDFFTSFNIAFQTFVSAGAVIYLSLYFLFIKRGVFNSVYVNSLYFSVMIGVFCAIMIMLITEYYTSSKFSAVSGIVKASEISVSNNILEGLSVGHSSVFAILNFLAVSLFISYKCTNSLLGPAFASVGMISVCSVILALDIFGPITDNAGGLVSMGMKKDESKDLRKITDKLDAIGNMTKATTKGYAVFSSGFAAYMLLYVFFGDYQALNNGIGLNCSLDKLNVFIGLFVGVSVASLFASQCLLAVSRISSSIIQEVRSQFNDSKKEKSNRSLLSQDKYNKIVLILESESLREMIVPSLVPIIVCLLLFSLMCYYEGEKAAYVSLVGYIVGINLSSILLSISMTVSGAAWDNAKKCFEICQNSSMCENSNSNVAGSNSESHGYNYKSLIQSKNGYNNAVIGDTIGDPFKDTAGPAYNPMMKLVGIVAILILKYSHIVI